MRAEINYRVVKDPKSAFQLVKGYLTPQLMEKFKVEAQFDYDEYNNEIRASGKGFDLTMRFLETLVEVDLDVSFFLKAFQKTIMEKIEKMLRSIL